MLKYAILFAVALVSSLALTPWVGRLALHFGVLDQPGGRKLHRQPTPRLGGLAVYGAMVVTFELAIVSDRYVYEIFYGWGWQILALALGATAVLLLGVIDDIRSLSPEAKLATQLAAGLAVWLSGYRIEAIGTFQLGILGPPLTLLWVVGVTNAFNLIDGLDGLAAGIGVIVSATLFSISVYTGDVASAFLTAALGGALLGFLRYNFYPARIFLGDSGSLLLGFVLSVVSIGTANRASAVVAILVPILALGLPIADTGLTVVRRLLRAVHVVRHDESRERYEFLFLGNVSLLKADREHIHHRLVDLGITHRNVVLLLYGICASLGVVSFAIVAVRNPDVASLLVAFAIAAVYGVRRLNYEEMRVLRNGMLLPIFESPIVSRRLLHVLLDLLFILVSYLAALWIANDGVLDAAVRARFLERVPLLALTQISAFALAGLYQRSYRYTGISDLFAMLRALVLAVAASSVGGWLIFARPALEIVVLDAYLLGTLAIGTRLSFRLLEHVFTSERSEGRRVLIYGAGRAGVVALQEIQDNPALGMTAVGFLDDQSERQMRIVRGCPIYPPDHLDRLIRSRQFDELIVSSEKIPEDRLREVAARCALAGLTVRRFAIGWEELPAARPVRSATA